MARKREKKGNQRDIAREKYLAGADLVSSHPMFAPLWSHCRVVREERGSVPDDGWAVVSANGVIHVHAKRRAEPEEWLYLLAHCLLHLGFGHFQEKPHPQEWNAARQCFAE